MDLNAGVGWDKDRLIGGSMGVAVEKKMDFRYSFETGIYYHILTYNLAKNRDFEKAFIDTSRFANFKSKVNTYGITYGFLTIPIGVNYYFSPKLYGSYKLGINFFSSVSIAGINSSDKQSGEGETIFTIEIADPGKYFKTAYINHQLSLNYILMRRIDAGIWATFTSGGGFIKDAKTESLQKVNKEMSKYFILGLQFRLYMFQLKSRKI
jgi:hypothetical protein